MLVNVITFSTLLPINPSILKFVLQVTALIPKIDSFFRRIFRQGQAFFVASLYPLAQCVQPCGHDKINHN
jgi:hypothetical protein